MAKSDDFALAGSTGGRVEPARFCHGLLNIILDVAHSAHGNILYYVYWSDNENIDICLC